MGDRNGCPTKGCNGLVTTKREPGTLKTKKVCLGCDKEWDA